MLFEIRLPLRGQGHALDVNVLLGMKFHEVKSPIRRHDLVLAAHAFFQNMPLHEDSVQGQFFRLDKLPGEAM